MIYTLIKDGLIWGHGHKDILFAGNKILKIAPRITPNPKTQPTTKILSAKDKLVFPGLINTHHHLTQSIAKGVPAGINADLNQWLGAVPFALFDKMTPEVFYTSARLGFYELLRSGCTTCADHFYLYHKDFDMEMETILHRAASEMGIRFVHCRGGSTHKGSHRGSNTVKIEPETADQFLERLDHAVIRYHDASDDAMSRVVVAPTSIIHTNPPEDLIVLARYARAKGLRMHSHLLEVPFDEQMAQKNYDISAVDYAESVEWLGEDVWFAHLVHADQHAIRKLADSGTGIAHCPVSNCRLGSGIASIPAMAKAGMPISLGVDGSASAESGSMINELMQTWLIHRASGNPKATEIEDVVSWATTGGAEVLGLPKVGQLTEGMCADLSVISLDDPRFWGVWDKQWTPVMCGEPVSVDHVFINGKEVFRNGLPLGMDLEKLRADTLQALKTVMNG